MQAVGTDLPKPSWRTCKERSVSGLTWRPILPQCFQHDLCTFDFFLWSSAKVKRDRWTTTITKNWGYSFLFILLGTCTAVVKAGKHASGEQELETHRVEEAHSKCTLPSCANQQFTMLSKLELIPNFQKLFIIIITISPQAEDNTLFRIITHFDLDKGRIMKLKEMQHVWVLMLTTHSTQHKERGALLRQRIVHFPQSIFFVSVIVLPSAPWSHITTLVKNHWVIFNCKVCLCPCSLLHTPQHSLVYTWVRTAKPVRGIG